MVRSLALAFGLAALWALPASAQFTDSAAPVLRQTATDPTFQEHSDRADAYGQTRPRGPVTAEPILGVRVVSDEPVSIVSRTDDELELRVDRGRANITVNHPAPGTLLLVDLPGGQADLLNDGFYTLNADTNVVRVVRGQAALFAPGDGPDAKGSPVEQGEQAELRGRMRATPADETTLLADEIHDSARPGERPRDTYRSAPGYGYGYGPYDYAYGWGTPYAYGYAPLYGYYGYAYPGWGYPGYAWDYPWGWSLGIGIYEPWYGYGYRGGYGYRPWAGGGRGTFNGPGRAGNGGWSFHPGNTFGGGSAAMGGGSRSGSAAGGGFHPGNSGGGSRGSFAPGGGGGGLHGGSSGGGFHGGGGGGGGGHAGGGGRR